MSESEPSEKKAEKEDNVFVFAAFFFGIPVALIIVLLVLSHH